MRARGFTYTVLDNDDAVIGCVYIYPLRETDAGSDADVRSWVRADRSHLDRSLYDAVSTWLRTAWPFEHVDYAARALKFCQAIVLAESVQARRVIQSASAARK